MWLRGACRTYGEMPYLWPRTTRCCPANEGKNVMYEVFYFAVNGAVIRLNLDLEDIHGPTDWIESRINRGEILRLHSFYNPNTGREEFTTDLAKTARTFGPLRILPTFPVYAERVDDPLDRADCLVPFDTIESNLAFTEWQQDEVEDMADFG